MFVLYMLLFIAPRTWLIIKASLSRTEHDIHLFQLKHIYTAFRCKQNIYT